MAFTWLLSAFRLGGQKIASWHLGRSKKKVAAFCRGRLRQSDQEFISECGLPDDPEAIRIGLAVRRAVATIGKVDPAFIYADDKYPDQLGTLPLWDNMDWVSFTLELENQLGKPLTGPGMQLVASEIEVKQMAADVYRLVKTKESLTPRTIPDWLAYPPGGSSPRVSLHCSWLL